MVDGFEVIDADAHFYEPPISGIKRMAMLMAREAHITDILWNPLPTEKIHLHTNLSPVQPVGRHIATRVGVFQLLVYPSATCH